MDAHEIWHLVVLAATLLGTAGAVIVLLAPLLFDPPPERLLRGRPYLVAGAVGLAAVLLLWEWLLVH